MLSHQSQRPLTFPQWIVSYSCISSLCVSIASDAAVPTAQFRNVPYGVAALFDTARSPDKCLSILSFRHPFHDASVGNFQRNVGQSTCESDLCPSKFQYVRIGKLLGMLIDFSHSSYYISWFMAFCRCALFALVAGMISPCMGSGVLRLPNVVGGHLVDPVPHSF